MKSKYSGCSKILKTISDPSRFIILLLLLEKAYYVMDLKKKLKIEATLLSHHLMVLRKEGILISKREGKHVLYTLAPDVKLKGAKKGFCFKCMNISLK